MRELTPQIVYNAAKQCAQGKVEDGAADSYVANLGSTHRTRLGGFYRLYCESLGFGPEVFALSSHDLDELRGKINWNWRTRKVDPVGPGWGRARAIQEIQARLAAKGVQ